MDRLLLLLPDGKSVNTSLFTISYICLPVSKEAFKISVSIIEDPRLVDKTDFFTFVFRLIRLEAAGSSFSRLKEEEMDFCSFKNSSVLPLSVNVFR